VSAKKRAELKPSQFGLPDQGHAISAVRLAKKNHKEGNLSAKDYKRISRKASKILKGG
jgi:hypothetical protein